MAVVDLSNKTVIPQVNTTVAAAWGHTQVNVVKLDYVWTIINYSFLPDETGRGILSPIFSAGPGEANWQMELYPNGRDAKISQYVSLYLHLVSSNQMEITAKVKFDVLSAKNEKSFNYGASSYTFPKGKFDEGDLHFMARDYTVNTNRECVKKFLLDDTLRILCEISASSDVVFTSGRSGTKDSIIFHTTHGDLPNDMGYLLESLRFSDVTLVGRNIEYKAHKVIVANRSSVLSRLFEEDQKKNRFVLTDMSREVSGEMMRFLYTDAVKYLDDLAGDLIVVAKEYELEKLQIMCEKTLFEKVSIDNAIDLLVIVNTSGSSQMKEKLLDFIVSHAGEVIRTKSFISITNSHPK